jgi:hypothetical protein
LKDHAGGFGASHRVEVVVKVVAVVKTHKKLNKR